MINPVVSFCSSASADFSVLPSSLQWKTLQVKGMKSTLLPNIDKKLP
jgi:hypothetical protein